MLVKCAKSKPHNDAILTITSSRIDKALSGCIGFQEKTKMFLGKCFWENMIYPMEELYQPLLRFLAFDLEEPIAKLHLENGLKNETHDS